MGVYSSKMRYTGTSGVDVESMVQSLMKAEGMKADKIFKQRTKLEWQQESMRTLGLSVKTFKNSYLSFSSGSVVSNMRSSATFTSRSLSGSGLSNGASNSTIKLGSNSTITATTDTPVGDYKVTVNSVAAKESHQGDKVEGKVTSTGNITLADIDGGDYMDMTVNGTKKRITFTQDEIDAVKNNPNPVDADNNPITQEEAFANLVESKMNSAFGTLGGKSKVEVTSVDNKLVFTANKDLGTQFSLTQDSSIAGANSISTATSIFDGVADLATMEDNDLGQDWYKLDGQTYKMTTALASDADEPTKAKYLIELNAKLGANGQAEIDADGKVIVKGTSKFNTAGTDTYTIGGKEVSVDYTAGQSKADYLKNLNANLQKEGVKATATIDDEGKLAFTATDGIKDITVSGMSRETYTIEEDGTKTGKVTSTIDISGDLTGNSSAITKIGFDNKNLSSSLNTNQVIGLDAGTFSINGAQISVDGTTTYKQLMDKVNATGKATLTFNGTTNTFKLESNTIGSAGELKFGAVGTTSNGTDPDTLDASGILGKLNLDTTKFTSKATDASVTIKNPNGTEQNIVRETNTFSFSGMNFKLDSGLQSSLVDENGVAKPMETTISVKADTSTVYDNIKKFLDDYNTLLDSLKGATKTSKAKSSKYETYEPLTDEEKEALSETQIKQYEEKAKQGILNKNPELERLQNKMREAMMSQVTLADGSKMSLANIGISTGDYTNGGKLYITDEAKLREALESNADGVAAMFTDSKNGVAEKLVRAVDEAVGTEGYITKKAGFEDSVYVNDNYYSEMIKSKQTDLDRLQEYLIDKENHYYTMFAAMENAINQSNSNMAALSSYS